MRRCAGVASVADDHVGLEPAGDGAEEAEELVALGGVRRVGTGRGSEVERDGNAGIFQPDMRRGLGMNAAGVDGPGVLVRGRVDLPPSPGQPADGIEVGREVEHGAGEDLDGEPLAGEQQDDVAAGDGGTVGIIEVAMARDKKNSHAHVALQSFDMTLSD